MLYRGSEVMREVAWVIFDEIHYMRDAGIGFLLFLFTFILKSTLKLLEKRRGGIKNEKYDETGVLLVD